MLVLLIACLAFVPLQRRPGEHSFSEFVEFFLSHECLLEASKVLIMFFMDLVYFKIGLSCAMKARFSGLPWSSLVPRTFVVEIFDEECFRQ